MSDDHTLGSPAAGPDGDDAPDPGDDAPTFDAPWQARAFALAVAITDGGSVGGGGDRPAEDLDWRAFQSELVVEIDAGEGGEAGEVGEIGAHGDDPEGVYYRQWLAALERVLVDRGLLDPGEFADRVAEFEAGDRSAHEFVEGDPHAHADRLPEGHAEGSHHDHGGHGHHHDEADGGHREDDHGRDHGEDDHGQDRGRHRHGHDGHEDGGDGDDDGGGDTGVPARRDDG